MIILLELDWVFSLLRDFTDCVMNENISGFYVTLTWISVFVINWIDYTNPPTPLNKKKKVNKAYDHFCCNSEFYKNDSDPGPVSYIYMYIFILAYILNFDF